VREHFYNGIISDIQMPGMDGLEFYRRAVEYDPKLKKRFLFYSADITPEREEYLKKNKLRFLRKPFALGEFMDTIDQIIRILINSHAVSIWCGRQCRTVHG
jgi:CheY-like chemotaxis protein